MTATDPSGTHAIPVPPPKKEGTFAPEVLPPAIWPPAPQRFAVTPSSTGKEATQTPSAPAGNRPAPNVALAILWWLGALLFIGGFITMIVGSNRTEPYRSMFDSAAESIVNSMTFAATTTLTVLIGGGVVLLGGMALVGALVATAVKTALGGPAHVPVAQK